MGDVDAQMAAKIIKQVEYYFSNSNLPTDKFLLGKVKENADGCTPLPTPAPIATDGTAVLRLAMVAVAMAMRRVLVVFSLPPHRHSCP